MPPALAIGGGTVLSGLISSRSSKRASDAQVAGQQSAAKIQADAADRASRLQSQATNRALDIQESQFGDTKELLTPFATGGVDSFRLQQAQSGALGPEAQREAFANFNASPGQQFLADQGMRAINANAGATGNLRSGNRLRSIAEFTEGLAQQDFGNQFNRLQQVTNTGLAGASALGGVGQNFAANASNTLAQGAANQGNILMNSANAQGNAFGNIGMARGDNAINQGNIFSSGVGDISNIIALNKAGLLG